MRTPLVLIVLGATVAACGDAGTEAPDPAPIAAPSNGDDAAPPETAPDAEPPEHTEPFDPYADDFTMSDESQAYLWDVEHFAFVLGTAVQDRMKKALAARRPERFAAFFAEEFTAAVPVKEVGLSSHGPVTEVTWSATDASRSFDRDQLAAHLVARVAEFAGEPQVRVHFELLSPTEPGVLDGTWTGTCTLTIEGALVDRGGSAQIGQEWRFEYARMGDDLPRSNGWITGGRVLRHWFVTIPRRLFTDGTRKAGFDTAAMRDRWLGDAHWDGLPTWSTALFDYDGDGRLDLLVFDLRTYLYRGLGDGRFEDVTKEAGLQETGGRTRIAVTVVDADGDGDDDLLLDEALGTRTPVQAVYENNGDGTFAARADGTFKLPPGRVGRGSVADYDGDGRLDVYVPNAGNASTSKERRWVGDRTSPEGLLLRNTGNFRFEDMTAAAGTLSGNRNIMAASWMDVESDGDMDLVLAHHMGENVVLENRGDGSFAQHVQGDGFGGFSMGLDTGDLDGDGLPDLYVANMSSHAGTRVISNLRRDDFPKELFPLVAAFVRGDEIIRNHGGLDFRREMRVAGRHASGWAYNPVLLDYDGDGLLDIYCPAGYQSVDPKKPDG